MIVSATGGQERFASYQGLRMTAVEYLHLEEDGWRYELVDGVVIESPSPSYRHQKVETEILTQIAIYLRDQPCGDVLAEVDVHLGEGDLVYRPDIVFIRTERVPQKTDHIEGPPDLVVEIVSESSRRYDYETKKHDYERFGVAEYWIIDPEKDEQVFYRLEEGRYIAASIHGEEYRSEALPQFRLDLTRVRELFRQGDPSA